MVHGVRLQEGRARWYRNRWIRSKAVGRMLGVPAAPGPRHGTFDTVNTNVIGHAGAAWALVEAGSTPVRLDETLEGQTYDDFGGTLKGAFTAHPRRDPATGELHAICYEATEPNEIRQVVVSAELEDDHWKAAVTFHVDGDIATQQQRRRQSKDDREQDAEAGAAMN
jgi:carotenoid cleavage dioxygenase-like enzyme